MDRLDKVSILAICCLVVGIAFLLETYPAHIPAPRQLHRQQQLSPELTTRIRAVRSLLESGNGSEAEEQIGAMISQYPYQGYPHMLQADLHILRQQPVLAMLEHRKAVDLTPDFLDKKAEVFQGKKIKNNLQEALLIIEAGLAGSPGEEKWKQYRKVLYYMQRRIAGSCG